MKKFLLGLLAFSSFFSLAAVAAPADTTTVQVVTVQVNTDEVKKKIGEVLEVLMVVNQNEINAGKVALKRSSNPDVKKFARMMIDDHSQNLEKTKKLSEALNIMPMDSKASMMLKKKGKNEVSELNSVPSRRFNKVYMEAMVKGHEAALSIIDNDLMPMATNNPRAMEHLKATRDRVAAHLQMAKDILNKL